MTAITRDDWLRAMAEAGVSSGLVDDQEAVTVAEFALMLGCSRSTANGRLEALTRHGKAIRTKKTVLNDYGRKINGKAYRLL